jgi:hypothetical protein
MSTATRAPHSPLLDRDSQLPSLPSTYHVGQVVEALSVAISAAQAKGVTAPVLVDCTVGCGGHSRALLARHPSLRVVGVDRDPQAGWPRSPRMLHPPPPPTPHPALARAGDTLVRPIVYSVLQPLSYPRCFAWRRMCWSPTHPGCSLSTAPLPPCPPSSGLQVGVRTAPHTRARPCSPSQSAAIGKTLHPMRWGVW